MTKSRLFLRNLARLGLNLGILIFICTGCSTSLVPTYSKADIEKTIPRILSEEYKEDAKAKLVGATFWIYLPLENLLEKADKPEKFKEKFLVEQNDNRFSGNQIYSEYRIKVTPEKEKIQEHVFSKKAQEKIGNALQVLRRVILSMPRRQRDEIKFFILVVADINTGFELTETIYLQDLIKVSYGFISPDEYRHRASMSSYLSMDAVGDKAGKHIEYKNLTLREFISRQVTHRINMKFQKPEVGQNVDLDKEIARSISETLKIYKVRNVPRAQLHNLFTKSKVILEHRQIYANVP